MTLTIDPGMASAVSALMAAPDTPQTIQVFKNILAGFEIDTFACGEIYQQDEQRNVFYVMEWPEAWRNFYASSKMFQRDPLVEALKQRQTPFTWTELRADRKFSSIGTEALHYCARHGWCEGLVVPIPRGNRHFGLVSLVGRRQAFDETEKALLVLLALCFHEKVRNFAPVHGFATAPADLSAREIDCLRLIARGATDSDVGIALGISPMTAHGYLENAKKKLRASSRAGAVALAVALTIVTP